MNQAELILMLISLWCVVGLIVATVFLTFGMDQIDEDARGAYVFRPLILPGVLLIWPLVLMRWYTLGTHNDPWGARYRPRRHNHRWVAFIMPIAIVVIISVGLSVRQVWPADIAPKRLTPPAEATE